VLLSMQSKEQKNEGQAWMAMGKRFSKVLFVDWMLTSCMQCRCKCSQRIPGIWGKDWKSSSLREKRSQTTSSFSYPLIPTSGACSQWEGSIQIVKSIKAKHSNPSQAMSN